MKFKNKLSLSSFFLLISITFSQYSSAHMMVAQHGTLNVNNDGAYMLLSLPVSAFEGVDDDTDGKLSTVEFAAHRAEIIKMIHNKIVLKDKSGKLALQGIILSPVTPHHSSKAPSSQLIVMGRFTLVHPNSALQYRVELFGKKIDEQLLEITATRKMDGSKQIIQLSPKKSNVQIF